eukprot:Gregarina_sp_Pseudo_9__486@NODE_130_length_4106_cov_61_699779_g122_i0_p1_GENE_NODE_130_length_4106_cov_61_699779_g122_i0NODE_130_length_4106_cov_61_699779_g122_i0_p1_ORF_typecomplete_len594_score148_81Glyco_transf_25/PF01755_17/99Glyco_transf_25/PF01755_17/0_15_NODE_130_length_4106_cov_61_699779_g122_i06802461
MFQIIVFGPGIEDECVVHSQAVDCLHAEFLESGEIFFVTREVGRTAGGSECAREREDDDCLVCAQVFDSPVFEFSSLENFEGDVGQGFAFHNGGDVGECGRRHVESGAERKREKGEKDVVFAVVSFSSMRCGVILFWCVAGATRLGMMIEPLLYSRSRRRCPTKHMPVAYMNMDESWERNAMMRHIFAGCEQLERFATVTYKNLTAVAEIVPPEVLVDAVNLFQAQATHREAEKQKEGVSLGQLQSLDAAGDNEEKTFNATEFFNGTSVWRDGFRDGRTLFNDAANLFDLEDSRRDLQRSKVLAYIAGLDEQERATLGEFVEARIAVVQPHKAPVELGTYVIFMMELLALRRLKKRGSECFLLLEDDIHLALAALHTRTLDDLCRDALNGGLGIVPLFYQYDDKFIFDTPLREEPARYLRDSISRPRKIWGANAMLFTQKGAWARLAHLQQDVENFLYIDCRVEDCVTDVLFRHERPGLAVSPWIGTFVGARSTGFHSGWDSHAAVCSTLVISATAFHFEFESLGIAAALTHTTPTRTENEDTLHTHLRALKTLHLHADRLRVIPPQLDHFFFVPDNVPIYSSVWVDVPEGFF